MTIPKLVATAFLHCRIKNTSELPLIAGTSLIFHRLSHLLITVSRSCKYLLRWDIRLQIINPGLQPTRKLSCSLGVDSSTRVIYHPQKKVSKKIEGWTLSKTIPTDVTSFTQRISVKNTHATPIARLVIRDHVPISQEARFGVNVIKPSDLGPLVTDSTAKMEHGRTLTSRISGEVVARWAQRNEEDGESGGSKGDGVIEWICSALKDKVDVELAWEVLTPHDMDWVSVQTPSVPAVGFSGDVRHPFVS